MISGFNNANENIGDGEEPIIPELDGTHKCDYCNLPATSVNRGNGPFLPRKYMSEEAKKKLHFTCHRCWNLEINLFISLSKSLKDKSPQTIESLLKEIKQRVLATIQKS